MYVHYICVCCLPKCPILLKVIKIVVHLLHLPQTLARPAIPPMHGNFLYCYVNIRITITTYYV